MNQQLSLKDILQQWCQKVCMVGRCSKSTAATVWAWMTAGGTWDYLIMQASFHLKYSQFCSMACRGELSGYLTMTGH